MIRIVALLGLLLAACCGAHPAHAQTTAGFDAQLATSVYTAALGFIAPRSVDVESVSRLTQWGLQGMGALDPALTVAVRDGKLRLVAKDKPVFEAPVPKDESITEWVQLAVAATKAAANASPRVNRAGTGRIVQAFFDELFNHLDPYSRYVPPAEAGEDRERRAGRAGIGLTLQQRGAATTVEDVIRDSPAAMAGIRPGDIVTALDGEAVRGLDASAIMGMIDGPEDTTFSLTWRGRDGKSRDANFVRTLVPAETIFGERSGDLLIIRLAGFNNTTDTHLAHLLQDGLSGANPPKGIVLDLRGNRGGLLRQAVTVADTFLPDGLVVSAVGRAHDSNHIWNSTAGELGENVPLVVLVDGSTASAAEVLAAALADRGRAVVVGSTTYGKGLVQTIAPLPDGGELYVTWSRVLAPLGWPIQGLGVLPQVCTSLGPRATQQQVAALAAGQQAMRGALTAHRNARAPLTPARIQSLREFCPATAGRDEDLSVARDLIANPAAYAAGLLPPMR